MRDIGPPANPSFLNVTTKAVFTPEQCDVIVSSADSNAWKSARISKADDPYGAIDPSNRSVLSQSLSIDESGWPLLPIIDAINGSNATIWRYELWGFSASDRPSILLYDGEVNDHFRPHLDAGEQSPTRKLSFSVQLSDPSTYRGGDLVLDGMHHPEGRTRGSVTVFPSILVHEVTPVYVGQRLAIVGWVHGPTFR